MGVCAIGIKVVPIAFYGATKARSNTDSMIANHDPQKILQGSTLQDFVAPGSCIIYNRDHVQQKKMF